MQAAKKTSSHILNHM